MKSGIAFSIVALLCVFGLRTEIAIGQSNSTADKIKVTLQTEGDTSRGAQAMFTVGEPVSISVWGHNQGDGEIWATWDRYRPHKFYLISLTKNGEPVKYTGKVNKDLEAIQESAYGSSKAVQLRPGEYKRISITGLQYWYENLEPGYYELTLSL